MSRVEESKLAQESAVIAHAPCAFNPPGVSKETCEAMTKVPRRNEMGCCAISCTSPLRLCRQCILGAGTPKLVTDPATGLCSEHKDQEQSTTALSRFEQRQTLPDFLPLSLLVGRARRERTSVSVVEDDTAAAVLPQSAESLARILQTLPEHLVGLAYSMGRGEPLAQMAHDRGVAEATVKDYQYKLFYLLGFKGRYSTAQRIEFIREAIEFLGSDMQLSRARTPVLEEPQEPFGVNPETCDVTPFVARVCLLEPQQQTVLKLIAGGLTNEEIGARLSRDKAYINVVVSNLYKTLDIRAYERQYRAALATRVWNAWSAQENEKLRAGA